MNERKVVINVDDGMAEISFFVNDGDLAMFADDIRHFTVERSLYKSYDQIKTMMDSFDKMIKRGNE